MYKDLLITESLEIEWSRVPKLSDRHQVFYTRTGKFFGTGLVLRKLRTTLNSPWNYTLLYFNKQKRITYCIVLTQSEMYTCLRTSPSVLRRICNEFIKTNTLDELKQGFAILSQIPNSWLTKQKQSFKKNMNTWNNYITASE